MYKPVYQIYVYPYCIKDDMWVIGIEKIEENNRSCTRESVYEDIYNGSLYNAIEMIKLIYTKDYLLSGKGLYERYDEYSKTGNTNV